VSRRNLWSVILRTMSHRAVILTTHSMDEAEALCKRIGIMVHGQLRALGTKQHLKNKFGSGFELVVKLIVKDFERQMDELGKFVVGMFPSAAMISENGGLVTYQIPLQEMKMGLAFTKLEENKEKLCIEDYSVAQPTLEQVRSWYCFGMQVMTLRLAQCMVWMQSRPFSNTCVLLFSVGVHPHGEQAHPHCEESIQCAERGAGRSLPRGEQVRLHSLHHADIHHSLCNPAGRLLGDWRLRIPAKGSKRCRNILCGWVLFLVCFVSGVQPALLRLLPSRRRC
jgi:hypothetical protein